MIIAYSSFLKKKNIAIVWYRTYVRHVRSMLRNKNRDYPPQVEEPQGGIPFGGQNEDSVDALQCVKRSCQIPLNTNLRLWIPE